MTEGISTLAVAAENVMTEPSLAPVGLGAPGWRPGIMRGITKIKNIVAINPKIEYTAERLALTPGSEIADLNAI